MTLVNIDLRNQGYETGTDDRVIFYSLLVRQGDFGTISTAPVEVYLVDGKATVDLAPGPVGVQILAGQVADTRVKIGEVPPSGTTTLNAVMMVTPAYTPALQAAMIAAIERARDESLSDVDRATAAALAAGIKPLQDAADAAKLAADDSARDAAQAQSSAHASSLSAASANSRVGEAVSVSENAVTRVTALEAMAGLGPESPVDGQTANLVAQPSTLTRSALDATYATLGEVRSHAKVDGTDQTTTLQGEINALMAAGGGTLVLPSGTIKTGPIVLPNDGATPPKQPVLFLRGTGMHWSGRSTPPIGGTIIEFIAPDPNGRGLISTRGLGLLSLEGLTLRNTDPAISTPFIYTTNTTVHVQRCAGIGAKTYLDCDQDFFVGGGTTALEGFGEWDHGFQGYGTYIGHNFFNGIRRIVYGRVFFNANWIEHNTIWHQCGNATGGAIELDGDPDDQGSAAQQSTGNSISFNLFEMPGYKYGIRLRRAGHTKMIGNDAFDAKVENASTMYDISEDCGPNLIIEGFTDARVAKYVDDRSGYCQVIAMDGSMGTSLNGDTRFRGNDDTFIARPVVNGSFGLRIQPEAPRSSEFSTVLSAFRSPADPVMPGAMVAQIMQNGTMELQGEGAGNIRFRGTDGVTRAAFQSNGRRWSVGASNPAQVEAYSVQLRDTATGSYGGGLRVTNGQLIYRSPGGTETIIGPA